ncbi:1-acylglycerol-3-phosphate O-acyltransferase [Coemansia thaxteri]|uniref:1-acylglycerol-3-phosphate O-acyltransferase n=1 Tax=Coemansia thaxteri TaxID=2663907 RepID=A0A9W8BL54_9FUNG|nr:1-acylglycerol-3-phosphate O-acyltransferase [Coemansia thaxteri]KAJ2005198.1 1-acylglycerol-3-phosphate O-acyltransferase [Coemansia thaxteri]KAJ2473619.1 1-acylglycerol-3-phosphate O-acyltransferase [Coemansia sp. RSA 2322]KAJ2487961.1 1-acylglycerol-3-phosphate O-acyltransferase [Coemansia sp. RSA 2320]
MHPAYRALGCLSFYVQLALFVQCILLASAVGILASPLLRALHRKSMTNWVGACAMHILARYLLGITVKVEGAEHLLRAKETPCVLVANHQSLLDTIWLSWIFPRRAAIVANMFISRLPVLGWFIRLGGNLFVKQGDKQSIKALFEDSLRYLEYERTSIAMFPEGKRNPSETGSLLEFKKGAFYLAYCTRAPIIPVAVQCTHSLYSWADCRFRRGCVIRIRVLAPISTECLTEEDIPALIASTRNDIQKACIALSSPGAHTKYP